eukprot:CAMPEP_0114247400 /NCGR_PEP_ID=MMETSP0058-20121206/13003_1 /TAXON_ID=36894 /ORGANISM="Pyramimonas parkeae, CCMP726" /LENGTH=178 /DNA_ID=CAMNT_0001360705 /DNA_START=541 /DNA_END=1077 /DNA_ORIENTATION=-
MGIATTSRGVDTCSFSSRVDPLRRVTAPVMYARLTAWKVSGPATELALATGTAAASCVELLHALVLGQRVSLSCSMARSTTGDDSIACSTTGDDLMSAPYTAQATLSSIPVNGSAIAWHTLCLTEYVVKMMFMHLAITNGIIGCRFSEVQLDKPCNSSMPRSTTLDENILEGKSSFNL